MRRRPPPPGAAPPDELLHFDHPGMHPPFTSDEGLPDAGMAYDLWVAARDASVAAGGVFAPEDEVLPDRPWNGIDGL